MRWWAQPSQAGNFQMTVTPWMVQTVSGIADNFLRQVMIGKEQHVQKVPQWYGETIGFWDGTTLVAWTAKVQGWTLTHSMFVSLFPNWTGQTQPRVVKIEGDKLFLSTESPIKSGGKIVMSRLQWQRAGKE